MMRGSGPTGRRPPLGGASNGAAFEEDRVETSDVAPVDERSSGGPRRDVLGRTGCRLARHAPRAGDARPAAMPDMTLMSRRLRSVANASGVDARARLRDRPTKNASKGCQVREGTGQLDAEKIPRGSFDEHVDKCTSGGYDTRLGR